MKFQPMHCPECGEPAKGTCDIVPGCARFTEPRDDGEVSWLGETEMYWDGQRTEYEDGPDGTPTNRARLQCHDGHTWYAEQVSFEQF